MNDIKLLLHVNDMQRTLFNFHCLKIDRVPHFNDIYHASSNKKAQSQCVRLHPSVLCVYPIGALLSYHFSAFIYVQVLRTDNQGALNAFHLSSQILTLHQQLFNTAILKFIHDVVFQLFFIKEYYFLNKY